MRGNVARKLYKGFFALWMTVALFGLADETETGSLNAWILKKIFFLVLLICGYVVSSRYPWEKVKETVIKWRKQYENDYGGNDKRANSVHGSKAA